jgi:hypothetical protein
MAGESIASSKSTGNPIGSAGVCMVESVPILDTSDITYNFYMSSFSGTMDNPISKYFIFITHNVPAVANRRFGDVLTARISVAMQRRAGKMWRRVRMGMKRSGDQSKTVAQAAYRRYQTRFAGLRIYSPVEAVGKVAT